MSDPRALTERAIDASDVAIWDVPGAGLFKTKRDATVAMLERQRFWERYHGEPWPLAFDWRRVEATDSSEKWENGYGEQVAMYGRIIYDSETVPVSAERDGC